MKPRDLDRIRFVTRYFHDLQGLTRVGFGLALLSGATGLAIPGPLGLAPIVVGGAAGIWLSRRSKSYYASRFGQVERRAVNPLSPRGQRVLILVYLVSLAWFFAMASFHPLAPSPATTARFFCFGCGALSIGVWWRRGSWLWQAHYLAFGVLCLGLGLAAPFDAISPLLLALSRQGEAYLLYGAYLLVTGLFDHLILVRTMPQLATESGALTGEAEAPR